MQTTQIYQSIKSLADQLAKDGVTCTRADLAFELKELGIDKDSLELGALIREAYEYYNRDPNIQKVFTNNEGNRLVVDEMAIPALMKQDSTKSAFELVGKRMAQSNESLRGLQELVDGFTKYVVQSQNPGFLNRIVGTYGTQKVNSEAQQYFEGYSMLVDTYANARTDVRQLMDVYGDSIKAVAPALFDFDAIQYLDVEETIKGDYARLAVVYKTLNDLYVPKANAFYRFSGQVLSAELQALFDALYLILFGEIFLSHGDFII